MPNFRVESIRSEFPILQKSNPNGKPLIYLDNAASTQKPQMVLDAMEEFYTGYYSKFGHLEGAEKMFRDANPVKMYADRAILSTVRPLDNEAFTAYAARETDQSKLSKAKEILDEKYGKGVADKILGK